MKVKTTELNGAALIWLVAICDGASKPVISYHKYGGATIYRSEGLRQAGVPFNPLREGNQAVPIIEREWLDPTPWPNESDEGRRWSCVCYDVGDPITTYGDTMLLAAMRCFVASKLGVETEVPEGLLQ